MKEDEKPVAVVEFLEKVSKTFPEARVEVDEPKDFQTGSWFFDVYLGDSFVVVEWRPDQGLGLSMICGDEGFGEGHDRAASSVDEALSLMTEMFSPNYLHPREGDDDSPLIQ